MVGEFFIVLLSLTALVAFGGAWVVGMVQAVDYAEKGCGTRAAVLVAIFFVMVLIAACSAVVVWTGR
jgi:hypothetical protein